jgi:hypothetical protein
MLINANVRKLCVELRSERPVGEINVSATRSYMIENILATYEEYIAHA